LAAAVAAASAGLPGCALPRREPAVPRDRTTAATVLGVPNERFRLFDDASYAAIQQEVADAAVRRRAAGRGPAGATPSLDMLSVSGGGENGAFGAGLLNGWSAHGSRPVFDLVTGVSTGALTAPFAFLGSAWDAKLKAVYTEISLEKVLVRRWITAALFNDALTDTTPLFQTISGHLDEAMVAAIAQGYAEGRLLLIGTTDLDAQMPVIWNIGAIARSGHPRALETIRRVLLASASIPGAFPPVMIDVEVDGRLHQEMHVDGGAFTQGFLYPSAATRARREDIARSRNVPPARAWVIRNGRLDPEWAATDRRTVSIAGRAVSTMTTASGYNDVVRMYFFTQRDGIDYNLAYIGRDFTAEYREPFEQAYMRALFDYAEARAARGYDWTKMPPM
jgi:predicted acylesterase/phospholipase RssA